MQFCDAGRRVAASRVDADDVHSKGGGEPRRFRADTAHADDQHRGLGQVDNAGVVRRRTPLALQLLRQILVQPTRERENVRHDVRTDMVIEDLAEIRHDRRMRDQLGVVPAGRRRCLRRLNPAQL